MGTESLSGVKSGRGVTLTPHPLLVPRSWKDRAIPLLPLWVVRPVQSFSACTRVHFTLPQCLYKGALYLTSVPVQGYTLPYLSACTRVHFTFYLYLYTCIYYLLPFPHHSLSLFLCLTNIFRLLLSLWNAIWCRTLNVYTKHVLPLICSHMTMSFGWHRHHLRGPSVCRHSSISVEHWEKKTIRQT